MAPEQVEGRSADARSDIFSLGAVIYETVTEQRAFKGDSPASVISAILKDEPPAIQSLQPLAPAALDHLVTGEIRDFCAASSAASRGGAWSPDGVIVFGGDSGSGFAKVSIATGKTEIATTSTPQAASHRWP